MNETQTKQSATDWSKPKPVDGLTMVFGPRRIDELLPKYADIPDEFKRSHGKWQDLVSAWFFSGLKNAEWTPKPGIETKTALAHLKACMSSWEPPHEHKQAGVAYLLSLWFDDAKYERAK